MALAATSTKNRFEVLADRRALDSDGAVLDRHEDYNLQLFVTSPVKQNKLNKTGGGEGHFLAPAHRLRRLKWRYIPRPVISRNLN